MGCFTVVLFNFKLHISNDGTLAGETFVYLYVSCIGLNSVPFLSCIVERITLLHRVAEISKSELTHSLRQTEDWSCRWGSVVFGATALNYIYYCICFVL